MNALEQKIIDFGSDQENIDATYAMLVVGRDKGDDPSEIMKKTIIDLLMRFHGIPYKPKEGN